MLVTVPRASHCMAHAAPLNCISSPDPTWASVLQSWVLCRTQSSEQGLVHFSVLKFWGQLVPQCYRRLRGRRAGVNKNPIPGRATIPNEIWCPLLGCLKTATVCLHIINKPLKKKNLFKKLKNTSFQLQQSAYSKGYWSYWYNLCWPFYHTISHWQIPCSLPLLAAWFWNLENTLFYSSQTFCLYLVTEVYSPSYLRGLM